MVKVLIITFILHIIGEFLKLINKVKYRNFIDS